MTRRRLEGFLVLVALVPLTSCRVTKERVEKWKKKKDVARLQKCLTDRKQADAIRAACGHALFELKKWYGVENMLARVTKRSPKEAARVAERMAKHYLARLRDTSDESVAAKDALYVLRRFLAPGFRSKVDERLIRWYVAHQTTVARAGEHSAKKVFQALGAHGAELLAKVVPIQDTNLFDFATHVRTVGSRKARDLLAKRIVDSLKKNPALQASALVLQSLGQACGKDTVPYLQNLALNGLNYKVRRNALIGLQLCPDKSSLQVAGKVLTEILSKALSGHKVALPRFKDRKPGVIGQAFNLLDRVSQTKSLKIDWKKDLAPIFRKLVSMPAGGPLPDEAYAQALLIRYQAAQYAIYTGKLDGLSLVFEALPSQEKSEDIYVNAPMLAAMDTFKKDPLRGKAKALAKDALKKENLTAKIVAVKILGALGDKSDVPALRALTRDRTQLPGWAEGVTLGVLASKTIAKLSAR